MSQPTLGAIPVLARMIEVYGSALTMTRGHLDGVSQRATEARVVPVGAWRWVATLLHEGHAVVPSVVFDWNKHQPYGPGQEVRYLGLRLGVYAVERDGVSIVSVEAFIPAGADESTIREIVIEACARVDALCNHPARREMTEAEIIALIGGPRRMHDNWWRCPDCGAVWCHDSSD